MMQRAVWCDNLTAALTHADKTRTDVAAVLAVVGHCHPGGRQLRRQPRQAGALQLRERARVRRRVQPAARALQHALQVADSAVSL